MDSLEKQRGIEEKVSSWLKTLKSRREECEQKGFHKQPVYFNYWVTGRSSYRDNVKGYCRHCLSGLSRPLNAQEYLSIRDFRKLMHEPMTI